MTYTLTFASHDDYLEAHLWAATIGPRTALAYMTEIHDECVASGHSHLLVIRDLPAILNLFNYFALAEDSVAILRGVKTAWVNPYPAIEHGLEFFCLTANNRGSMYKLFPARQQAEKWLGTERRVPAVPLIPSRTPFLLAA
jgi:hypothetical protein